MISVYAGLGRDEESRRLFARLSELAPAVLTPDVLWQAHYFVGEIDSAMDLLNVAIDEGYPISVNLLAFDRDHPVFDDARGHPGFQRALAKVPPGRSS